MFDVRQSHLIERELEEYGVYASITAGVSMRPLFKTGRDMVIIEKPKGELSRFDVALYRSRSGAYTLHRVIRVKDDEYLIRGDNTFRIEHIAKDRVIGVLTAFNRKGKRHSTSELGYRIYSRVWNFIYPVRYLIHLPRLILGKVYRKFFRKIYHKLFKRDKT